MPELPEVETIKRTLAGKVEGRVIQEVEVLLSRLIKWPSAAEFSAIITGKAINSIVRKGKYLLVYLEGQYVLVIHLRMTGRLYYVSADAALDKFVRIVFRLDNGDCLIYADTRTLGTLYLMQESELWRIAGLASLGPEPLTEDFTPEYLSGILRGRLGKIKAVLLNQQLVGGLGNIYADECLALSGIHPERLSGSLTEQEIAKLHAAINQVIEAGIAHGGTTFRDYRDGTGKSGTHQHHLHVYGRNAKPCKNCGTEIVRIEVGGRGTHFCPQCQK